MAALDRLDEVKREASPTTRELFVAADKKALNMPLARAITRRLTTAVKGRHAQGKNWHATRANSHYTNAALSRNHQDCPRRSPNRDAALSALKPDGGTGGRCYSGCTVCALWPTILRTALTSQHAVIIGQWLDAGSSSLLNQAILTHDVGARWADAARWLVRICDAGDTARR